MIYQPSYHKILCYKACLIQWSLQYTFQIDFVFVPFCLGINLCSLFFNLKLVRLWSNEFVLCNSRSNPFWKLTSTEPWGDALLKIATQNRNAVIWTKAGTITSQARQLLRHANHCVTPTTASRQPLRHANHCVTPTTASIQPLTYV